MKGNSTFGPGISQKSVVDLNQSELMKKNYLRLERRNTRFKLETIN